MFDNLGAELQPIDSDKSEIHKRPFLANDIAKFSQAVRDSAYQQTL
jgi:hypothetical protein